MRCNKRAQFFLFAAIVISAIVINLGIILNYAYVSPSEKTIEDFSYQIKREVGNVINYELYTGVDKVDEFVEVLATKIRDENPDANFIFVYGSRDNNVTIANYGNHSIITDVDGETSIVSGAGYKIVSKICYPGFGCTDTVEYSDEFSDNIGRKVFESGELYEIEKIQVLTDWDSFNFSISQHNQVIFVLEKNVEDEVYVTFS